MRGLWWSNAANFAFGVLGMKPKEFWQLTLPEFNLLIKAKFPDQPRTAMSRSQLQDIINAYPDTKGY
ncbi:MAG: phage tail assembly chaperone [Salaquimonas sp.]